MPLVAFVIAAPLVMILGATFGTMLLPAESGLLPWLTFFGNPAVALLIAVLLAFYFLGVRRGMAVAELGKLTGESLKPIGMVLLVVGAGAFFGKVISATGIGAALADTLSAWGLPVIVLAYVISCGLRIAQGSATVAIVTTGGIVGPLVMNAGYSQIQLALIAMAIAAGSIIASHVNDGGFWIIAKYFNMTVKQTLQTWTVLETVLSVVSFAVAGHALRDRLVRRHQAAHHHITAVSTSAVHRQRRNLIRQIRCTALASLVTEVPTSTPRATAKMVMPVSTRSCAPPADPGRQAGHPAEARARRAAAARTPGSSMTAAGGLCRNRASA